MKIIWSFQAASDLKEIYDFIAEDKKSSALAVYDRIKQKIELLSTNPGLGRPGRVEGTRELILGDYPYVIPYRVREGKVQIIRILHSARRWPSEHS